MCTSTQCLVAWYSIELHVWSPDETVDSVRRCFACPLCSGQWIQLSTLQARRQIKIRGSDSRLHVIGIRSSKWIAITPRNNIKITKDPNRRQNHYSFHRTWINISHMFECTCMITTLNLGALDGCWVAPIWHFSAEPLTSCSRLNWSSLVSLHFGDRVLQSLHDDVIAQFLVWLLLQRTSKEFWNAQSRVEAQDRLCRRMFHFHFAPEFKLTVQHEEMWMVQWWVLT